MSRPDPTNHVLPAAAKEQPGNAHQVVHRPTRALTSAPGVTRP